MALPPVGVVEVVVPVALVALAPVGVVLEVVVPVALAALALVGVVLEVVPVVLVALAPVGVVLVVVEARAVVAGGWGRRCTKFPHDCGILSQYPYNHRWRTHHPKDLDNIHHSQTSMDAQLYILRIAPFLFHWQGHDFGASSRAFVRLHSRLRSFQREPHGCSQVQRILGEHRTWWNETL